MNVRKISPLRTHKAYLAFVGHRLSGLALAIFLPIHFFVLGTALNGPEQFEKALVFTDLALFKFAEWGLVVLLSLHLFFGIRILMLEFTRWPTHTDARAGWILPGFIAALFVGTIFLLQR